MGLIVIYFDPLPLPFPYLYSVYFFLSEERVEFKDMYEEFDQSVATKHKIMEYKCRKTTKKYAFEMADVPQESEYLEIIYSATQPRIPEATKGKSFSHIFGTNTSSLELLLLNRKLQVCFQTR